MKIFCMTCKDLILLTTDAFVLGGPYHGAMFESARHGARCGMMFRQLPTVKNANLHCPRCMGAFVSRDGQLLTEHGRVRPGQESIDTSINIVHTDGIHKGRLRVIEDSREMPEEMPAPQEEAEESEDSSEQWGKSIMEQVNEAALEMLDKPMSLVCDRCGKVYKNTDSGRPWYEKHIAKCDK